MGDGGASAFLASALAGRKGEDQMLSCCTHADLKADSDEGLPLRNSVAVRCRRDVASMSSPVLDH